MVVVVVVVVVMMMWESKAQTLHWCVSRNTVVRKQNLAWISFKRKKKKKVSNMEALMTTECWQWTCQTSGVCPPRGSWGGFPRRKGRIARPLGSHLWDTVQVCLARWWRWVTRVLCACSWIDAQKAQKWHQHTVCLLISNLHVNKDGLTHLPDKHLIHYMSTTCALPIFFSCSFFFF